MEVVLLVHRLIMSAAVVLFMPDTLAQVKRSLSCTVPLEIGWYASIRSCPHPELSVG